MLKYVKLPNHPRNKPLGSPFLFSYINKVENIFESQKEFLKNQAADISQFTEEDYNDLFNDNSDNYLSFYILSGEQGMLFIPYQNEFIQYMESLRKEYANKHEGYWRENSIVNYTQAVLFYRDCADEYTYLAQLNPKEKGGGLTTYIKDPTDLSRCVTFFENNIDDCFYTIKDNIASMAEMEFFKRDDFFDTPGVSEFDFIIKHREYLDKIKPIQNKIVEALEKNGFKVFNKNAFLGHIIEDRVNIEFHRFKNNSIVKAICLDNTQTIVLKNGYHDDQEITF